MKTTVKHISDTRVELTITVDSDALQSAEQVALTKLAKDVKAPGFRKGKVPASVAAKYVDQNSLMQQTLDDALSKAVADAFIAEDIQALARPEVAIKKFVPRSELEFTAETDIVPAVELGDYKNLGVKTEKPVVSAKEVNDVIERMRAGVAEKKDVNRAAKSGDEVTIDFVGKKDGIAFDGGTAEDYALELGSNSFIPGFEDGIIGLKAGDKKDLELSFPDNYHVPDLAGANVVFETTVKKIQEKVLPELNDEFAKSAGSAKEVTTLKELKADIKTELTAQVEREAGEKRKDDLVSKLIEVSKVPTPQVLVDDQVRSIEQDTKQNLLYQNLTIEQYLSTQGFKDEEEWKTKEVLPAAEKRVRAGLALAELSKVLEVQASDEEKTAFIDRYKAQYSNNPDIVKRFDEPEVLRDLMNRLLTEKTVDTLVELNK